MCTLSEQDPYASVVLDKYSDHFEEKQKIRIKKDGREGTIETIGRNGHLNVKLDSGHSVQCLPEECEPADFPGAHHDDDGAVAGMANASLVDGLIKAIEAGTIADADLAIIKMEIFKIQSGNFATDPLAISDRNPAYRLLEIFARKYSEAETNELQKRRKPRTDLRRGMKVRHSTTGQIGEIIEIDGYVVKVLYPGSVTPATELDHSIELAA